LSECLLIWFVTLIYYARGRALVIGIPEARIRDPVVWSPPTPSVLADIVEEVGCAAGGDSVFPEPSGSRSMMGERTVAQEPLFWHVCFGERNQESGH